MNEEKTTALENRDGKITPVDIGQEMQKSFLEYAMSVIVARALPDVRDGLKPVHRRILYTMYENNLTPRTISVRIQLVLYWDAIIHTVTHLSMMLWCVWHRISPCDMCW